MPEQKFNCACLEIYGEQVCEPIRCKVNPNRLEGVVHSETVKAKGLKSGKLKQSINPKESEVKSE